MASEVIEGVVEEVAANLEEAAAVTRNINTSGVGYFLGGAFIGLGIGFYIGRKLMHAKIRAEVYAEAEEQISEIRKIYRRESIADAMDPKPPLEEVVQELGYAPKPPEFGSGLPRPLKAPVPIITHTTTGNYTPPEGLVMGDPDPMPEVSLDTWDWDEEKAQRSEEVPYVIHQNEWNEVSEDSYQQVVYTYYAKDDVLVDTEDGHPVPHGDLVVGQENLKWGHGSDDADVVFVRNDRLELDIQICRSPLSYEEEVLGVSDVDTDDS